MSILLCLIFPAVLEESQSFSVVIELLNVSESEFKPMSAWLSHHFSFQEHCFSQKEGSIGCSQKFSLFQGTEVMMCIRLNDLFVTSTAAKDD